MVRVAIRRPQAKIVPRLIPRATATTAVVYRFIWRRATAPALGPCAATRCARVGLLLNRLHSGDERRVHLTGHLVPDRHSCFPPLLKFRRRWVIYRHSAGLELFYELGFARGVRLIGDSNRLSDCLLDRLLQIRGELL